MMYKSHNYVPSTASASQNQARHNQSHFNAFQRSYQPAAGQVFADNDPHLMRAIANAPDAAQDPNSRFSDPDFYQGVAASMHLGETAATSKRLQEADNSNSATDTTNPIIGTIKDMADTVGDFVQDTIHDATRWHFEDRDDRNINLPNTLGNARRLGNWTQYPSEQNIYHDNKKGKPEIKMVHPDGREAIYDGDTHKLITDPSIAGTFNYSNSAVKPEGKFSDFEIARQPEWIKYYSESVPHLLADVVPYYLMGNERGFGDDPLIQYVQGKYEDIGDWAGSLWGEEDRE